MDATERKVAAQIYSMVIDAYGLPGYLRPCPDGCGQTQDRCECDGDDE